MFDCVHDFFDYHADIRPDVLFAEDSRQSLSYREAQQRSRRIASRLHAAGLKKGERVALLAKNSVDHVMVYLACVRLGVVPVGLNYRLSAGEWSFIAADAGIQILFAELNSSTSWRALLPTSQPSASTASTNAAPRLSSGLPIPVTIFLPSSCTVATSSFRCIPAVPRGDPKARC